MDDKNRELYIERVNSFGIFDNSFDTAFGQTAAAKVIRSHFAQSGGKKPKCLFIGWDGARADSMIFIVKSKTPDVTGDNWDSPYSAICEIKHKGGLYITYVGGDEGNLQETSTIQGWSSALTGEWCDINGAVDGSHPIKEDCPTVLRELAENGISASFLALWPVHFNMTYKPEVELAQKGEIPLEYTRYYSDMELHNALLDHIKGGTDMIFGIYENPDSNGHGWGFGADNYKYVVGVTDFDRFSYALLREIEARPDYENEDWLILIGSDHGGHEKSHGTQLTEDRMTFLASSKKLDPKDYM